MKQILALCLLISSFSSFAFNEGELGVGAMLGNPTGVSTKYWLGGDKAVDAGFGFSFGSSTNLAVHSDYLFHSEGALFLNDVHPLDLYFGLGGRMKFADDILIGARVPIGVVYKDEGGKSDMFLEVAPVIDFISRVGMDLHLLCGARYYFN